MNILKIGGTLFLAYEGRMGRATKIVKVEFCQKSVEQDHWTLEAIWGCSIGHLEAVLEDIWRLFTNFGHI